MSENRENALATPTKKVRSFRVIVSSKRCDQGIFACPAMHHADVHHLSWKMSKTISERLKKSAGKVFDEVKETLNRPSRRNSDAELVKDTPEKVAQGQVAPSTTDGKGSVREIVFYT